MPHPQQFSPRSQVVLGGVLGEALQASRSAHLDRFICDENSPAIALFGPDHVCQNHEGDWYGEHAGKWLCAAALAVQRTGDPTLATNLRRVANYLVNRQSPDGYLGTYAPERRFMCRQMAGPRTWDGAPTQRTWDVWVHSYLILGLLEAGRALSQPAYTDAARRIGDLCWKSLTEGGIDITTLGNHHGLSATILLDPAVELYFATNDKKYLELAELILHQSNNAPALALLPQALQGADAAFIGTGKAYQLCWMLTGLAKLHRATGKADYLRAVQLQWESIRAHHLTLGGGPWGGVGHRSREVFNAPGFFSPQGLVETCSTFAWIQFNREMLALTGEAKYADEIERAAYNDLLGAQTPDGSNWCYYSYPNGRRVYTTYWRCCKSSGPWALEELPSAAYAQAGDNGIAVNLYGPGRASLSTRQAGSVRLEQTTGYPLDDAIRLSVQPERAGRFTLSLRIPGWAEEAAIQVNGVDAGPAHPGSYAALDRAWNAGDVVTLRFPMPAKLHRRANRNVQESRAPDGSPVAQEVLRHDYVAITRGPLVYSTGLIDGYKTEETIRLPPGEAGAFLSESAPLPGGAAPTLRLEPVGRAPLVFTPYYEAGGRTDGAWRITWLSLAPDF